MAKRAYGVTVSELSAVFFLIGMLMIVLALFNISGLKRMIDPVNPGIGASKSSLAVATRK